jgi:hypothetical protein
MVQYVKSSRASSPNAKVQDVPNVPTIGTAIRNVDVIEVPFTPATTGGQAAIYRAVSNPGGIEAISFGSSPISVPNLDDGVARTFTVRGETSTGATTGFSAASNAVTVPRSALEPIASVTLTANTGPIAFNSIPQNYQDLMLVINATAQNGNGLIYVTFNNTYPNTLSTTYLTGNGSSASSSRVTANDKVDFTAMSATIPTTIISHFLNYANTSTFKTILSRYAGDYNGSGMTRLMTSLLQITGGITGIQINTQTGSDKFLPGSTFTLYGIRAA